jgi:hypothetical protein
MAKTSLKEILEKIQIPPLYDCGITLDKYSRIKTYYYHLENEKQTNSAQETLDLINSKMVEVENCHSGVEAEEKPGKLYAGRMYPIQEDNIDRRANGRIVAMTSGNRIVIEPDGSFTIFDKRNEEPLLIRKYE